VFSRADIRCGSVLDGPFRPIGPNQRKRPPLFVRRLELLPDGFHVEPLGPELEDRASEEFRFGESKQFGGAVVHLDVPPVVVCNHHRAERLFEDGLEPVAFLLDTVVRSLLPSIPDLVRVIAGTSLRTTV